MNTLYKERPLRRYQQGIPVVGFASDEQASNRLQPPQALNA
jgi:hypothetical protein